MRSPGVMGASRTNTPIFHAYPTELMTACKAWDGQSLNPTISHSLTVQGIYGELQETYKSYASTPRSSRSVDYNQGTVLSSTLPSTQRGRPRFVSF